MVDVGVQSAAVAVRFEFLQIKVGLLLYFILRWGYEYLAFCVFTVFSLTYIGCRFGRKLASNDNRPVGTGRSSSEVKQVIGN
jgi:hypothetical protein